mmetsp:Transcript_432/g.780  ORF Transcript_432/g.780 Transcript_432/m.780 type:complete len:321 (-) Transcript_432:515-1477(-)
MPSGTPQGHSLLYEFRLIGNQPDVMSPVVMFVPPALLVPRRSVVTRRAPRWISSSSGDPNKVSASFYKRPSKAIERGGGFYVPGLRGYRLRIAVGALIGVLSLANLVACADSLSPIFLVSQFNACFGACALLYWGFQRRREEKSEYEGSPSLSIPKVSLGLVSSGSGRTHPEDFELSVGLLEDLAWLTAVVTDLTAVSSVVLFREGQLLFSSGPAVIAQEREEGPVVSRVAAEGKPLYVDDISTLPEGIEVPFLEGKIWSVFLYPLGTDKAVLVFAAPSVGSISSRDREWIQHIVGKLFLANIQDTDSSEPVGVHHNLNK